MNIFVGNLSFEAKEADLQKTFSVFGAVEKVIIVKEKKGAKSRGFGFVLMVNDQEAQNAIDALNGKEILGRPVKVMPAVPRGPLKRTGKYKEGRRSLSYMKKRMESGITAVPLEQKYKPNPMRWRKKTKRTFRKDNRYGKRKAA